MNRPWFSSYLFIVGICLVSCAPSTANRLLTIEQREIYEKVLTRSVLLMREEKLETYSFARAGFELLIELNPKDPRGWDGMASIAIRVGKLERAIEYLEYASYLDPNYDSSIAHLGFVAELQEKHALAEEYYLQALRINPTNEHARMGLSRISTDDKRLSQLQKLTLLQ